MKMKFVASKRREDSSLLRKLRRTRTVIQLFVLNSLVLEKIGKLAGNKPTVTALLYGSQGLITTSSNQFWYG